MRLQQKGAIRKIYWKLLMYLFYMYYGQLRKQLYSNECIRSLIGAYTKNVFIWNDVFVPMDILYSTVRIFTTANIERRITLSHLKVNNTIYLRSKTNINSKL